MFLKLLCFQYCVIPKISLRLMLPRSPRSKEHSALIITFDVYLATKYSFGFLGIVISCYAYHVDPKLTMRDLCLSITVEIPRYMAEETVKAHQISPMYPNMTEEKFIHAER